MKKRKIIFIILPFLVVIFGVVAVFLCNSRPVTPEEFEKNINDILQKSISKNDNISGIQMSVSFKNDYIDKSFVMGKKGDEILKADNPFHSASIGKTFFSTLIYILAERGELSLQNKIVDYFDPGFLDGLFVFEGINYQEDVTIEHLITHTSGVADCFEGDVIEGQTMKELLLSSPDKKWTQQELIDFSRFNQKAVGKPGEKFLYSDTGYTLLGLIIEDITGKSFHEVLHEEIFEPLEMNDSYSMFYSKAKNQPQKSIATIWFEGVNVTDCNSLSAGLADGGIVTTLSDLKIFIKALFNGKIISEDSLSNMRTYNNEFIKGIHYGQGIMQLQFGEFMFILKNMPPMEGHMGSLGTYMLYNPEKDICIIANYGSSDYTEKSIRDLINVMRLLDRIKE
jgi:D-alanyl-D-alanine carboxypeptidase